MSSHNRVKGKAKKSGASNARAKGTRKQSAQPENVSTPPTFPRIVEGAAEHADFKLSTDQITSITASALTQFHRTADMPQTPARDHRTRVDEILRGIHVSVPADAAENVQAEQYLLSSIIVALRPFWSQQQS